MLAAGPGYALDRIRAAGELVADCSYGVVAVGLPGRVGGAKGWADHRAGWSRPPYEKQ
ncbi:hypothetical protein GCM10027317_23700 [Massilia agri]